MDPVIGEAARALARGDPLDALQHVALREDAPAVALRGTAMAQLGDFARARALLRRAARMFGPKNAVARARCIVALAEVALASRELNDRVPGLDAARATLEASGDRVSAAYAGYLEARRLLLIGRLDEAGQTMAAREPAELPPALRALHELVAAGIALRRVHASIARDALERSLRAARQARIPALVAEVESAKQMLEAPAARLVVQRIERPIVLDEVERLFASRTLVVDACRNVVRQRGTLVSLATRPVLFELVRILGEAWPGDVDRATLLARAVGAKFTDESHRMRLRVEIGRLRAALRPLAGVTATKRGFALQPNRGREVAVLARPVEERHADVLAFLTDGEAWSSSALALALGTSQRTVQRALDALAAAGRVQSFGRARARRWVTPPTPGFTPTLLLPVAPPSE